MRDTHEPRSEFVERLESHLALEVRRRNRDARAPRWTTMPRWQATMAAMVLMLASMGIGAAATAATYNAQGHAQRDQLLANLEQRAELARQRRALAGEQQAQAERRVSVGMAGRTEVLDGRLKVAQADAELKSIELQIEEVRLTGRDARTELSAPLVNGRDFVSERLRMDMAVTTQMLDREQAAMAEADKRVKVGMADALEVDSARVRQVEAEAAVNTLRRKLDIRQKFLSGGVDAVETELRVLEAEAEQRKNTLAPRIEFARKEADRAAKKAAVGAGEQVDLTKATLRRLELETELAKADLDLALVRRQIEQHRVGR